MIAPAKTAFVPGPIMMGRNTPLSLSSSNQPIMAEAILDWFSPMSISIITTSISEEEDDAGESKEVERTVKTSGVLRPGDGEKLSIKAEGERTWQGSVLYTTPDFNEDNDTRVRIMGTAFRIVKRYDYSQNGHLRYEVLEDYVGPS